MKILVVDDEQRIRDLIGQYLMVEGYDVLDAIAAVKTDSNNKPLEDVIIESIEFDTY